MRRRLFELQDLKYRDFQAGLIPNIEKDLFIGVRTPELRKLAKEIANDEDTIDFLNAVPHKYFDENQLHAFILSEEKNFEICIKKLEKFLPYIDNWATCDQLCPKCFKKNKSELIKCIGKWLKSKRAYTVRFAIEMLMSYFLDEDFDKKYLDMVSNIRFKSKYENVGIKLDADKYYVEMMIAWYFATALAKQYKSSLSYIKNKKLLPWTHNKTIQKAIESFRVSDEHKKELRKLKL